MTFQWPYALVALALLPAMVGLYVLAQRRRRAYALRFASFALLSEVVTRRPGFRRHIPPLLYLASLTALLLSLARPTAAIATPRNESAVELVLDVSGSMSAADIEPSRLGAAQRAAHDFVAGLPTDTQVGLISFASAAAVRVPLGRDRAALDRAIDALQPNGGTAIGDGLDAALDQLGQRPADAQGRRPPGLVVLLSDGESTAGTPPDRAGQRAAADGVRVHTVGIGERGRRTLIGQGQRVGLDETTMQRIAEQTGGQYFYAAEAGQLQGIYRDLSRQIGWTTEPTEITALFAAAGSALMTLAGLLGLRWFQQLP
jgi:Ca-activated chloride channel family protein